MKDLIQMRTEYVNKVIGGKCNRKQAEEELREMEKQFGDNAFTSFNVTRKSKPWDMEYLKELETIFISGAASREFFEYIAEVAEDVFARKKKKCFALFIGIGLAVILFIVIIFSLLSMCE